MKKSNGYTLIEVVAIIVIIIFITGLILPSFKGLYTTSKLKATARAIVSDIRYTQQLAIANKKQATIHFNQDEDTYNISQSLKTVKSASLVEGVDFDVISFDNKRCIFGASGSPNGGSIYIKLENKFFTITVKPVTGRVVVYEYKK